MDMSKFDLSGVEVSPSSPVRSTRLPTIIKGEPFFSGPVPMAWMEKSARLPGKAFQVAMMLWHQGRLQRTSTVRLSNCMVEPFGVQPDAKRRALAALELAGLVLLEQAIGQAPVVTIISEPTSGT